ncbi:M50 family metallopeptidase [Streptomyces sp. NPDC088354]|uniref:M50 family metallopeptidase n=1 Tax=unclassified Streptomyces TaxID=2593676 RepID=UPI0029BF7025|nr:site-2 protease family protein [Streptomyces sp. MI02-7b]MDX3077954.1 site-2 protease family protein [Streptomyces sp. MI02-7b]
MTALMWVLGLAVFFVGLLVSIAWHELGHLSTAKLFKIRVPQYMVGFGPTIWSRHKGETEYGVKAVPLGGYIRMIGMFPPGDDGRITARSTSPFRGMIEDARSAAYEELQPGDETRMFYTRKPWKRVIVMFAGPFMNLILAFGLFLMLFMVFGLQTQTTTVGSVSDCVIPASDTKALDAKDPCAQGTYPAAPAKAAGLQKRDRIVALNGVKVDDSQWSVLQQEIRKTIGPATITVVRDGKTVDLHANLIANKVVKTDSQGLVVKGQYVQAGFLGFTPANGVVRLGFGQSVDHMATTAEDGVRSLGALPGKIPALWNSVFNGAERQPDSPVGMIGAARLGGDVFSLPLPATQKIALMVNLLAGVNLALFLFNMLPLLPLDGGHIAGALWESLRRNLARVFRRPDPGPFDVAKLMPVAYVIAGVFICFTALVMAADLINPVRLT